MLLAVCHTVTIMGIKYYKLQQTQEEWQIVFYIAAAVYGAGLIFFLIFADGELQDWVKPYMFDKDEAAGEHLATYSPDDRKGNVDDEKRSEIV